MPTLKTTKQTLRRKTKGILTATLLEAMTANPQELANLIMAEARKGSGWAIKLWAQYVQDPDSVTRELDHATPTDTSEYSPMGDPELEQLISLAESILLAPDPGTDSPGPD